MAFRIKDFQEISAGSIEYMRAATQRVTDYNVGSVVRTLLEANAIEVEDLYQAMYHGLIEAIPTAIYQAFQFSPLPAVAATGVVRFTLTDGPRASDTLIAALTQVRAPGAAVSYAVQADLTLAAGQASVDTVVLAQTAGALGNALASTVTEVVGTLAGVTVTNPNAFTNGRDAETEPQRKQRFIEYVNSLSRGTVAAITFAAKQAVLLDAQGGIAEYVASVGVNESIPGRVLVYISSGSANTSDALVTRAQQIIDGYIAADGTKIPGYRAAGVQVVVGKVTPITVALTATVAPAAGYTLDGALVAAVTQAFDRALAEAVPGEVWYVSEAVAAIMSVTGVAGVNISQPANNIALGVNQILLRGTTSIS